VRFFLLPRWFLFLLGRPGGATRSGRSVVLEAPSWPCAPCRAVGSGRMGMANLGVAGTGVVCVVLGEEPDIATWIATAVVS
jgi:hypothetical protein